MRKSIKIPKDSCLLLTDEYQRKYFSRIDVAEGYLVLGKANGYFTDARYNYAVNSVLTCCPIKSYLYHDISDIKNFLLENQVKVLYIDFEKTNVVLFKQLKKFGVKVKDIHVRLEKALSVKNNEEIKCIVKACGIIEDAVKLAFENIYEGITENQVREIIRRRCNELGADGESFDTIVAFGKNSAVPHHVTDNTMLKFGDVVLIDTGCKVNGYCSDITRTAIFGRCSEEFKRDYNLVLEANLKAEKEIRSCMQLKEADRIARDVFKREGKDEFFTHSLGHGLGLEIHEYPYLSPKKKGSLKNNMVFTVEPGLYFNGKYGIRIEDTVVLKSGKVQRLYCDSKELLIL